MSKLFISGDHAATSLIEHIQQHYKAEWLQPPKNSKGSIDYPKAAEILCGKLSEEDKGILVCGSGIGINMAANRYPHIRAALCYEPFGAEMARRHNDANVLCLGARFSGVSMVEKIIEVFLNTSFEGGRHQKRVEMFSLPETID